MASSSDAPNLSCNIAKELRRWRGDAKSRLLFSGSSRSAHIRPWEGKIPIHAPSQTSPRSFSRSRNDQIGGKALLSLPQRQNVEKARGGEDRRRRPVTARATRTRSTAPPAGRSTGNKKALGMTAQRGGAGEAALAPAAPARAGLLSSTLENDFRSTWPDDRHRIERVATWRVFDSTAAEWVHTAVLKHGARHTPATATGARCAVARSISSAAAGQGEGVGGASLTTAAKGAIEEVFDRFDCSSKAGRGFLLPTEISALQEIWTRPDAEPPPPRLLPKPKSARRTSPQLFTATTTYRGRSAAGSGGRSPLEVSEAGGKDGLDKGVLTRPAFVEFCRRAAARDAIFIRHFFTRSGYDYRLELPVLPIATITMPVASSASRRKGSVVSERRQPKDSNHAGGSYQVQLAGSGSRQGSRSQARLRRGGSLGGVGGGSGGKGVEPPASPLAASSQDRTLFEHHDNDELRCLASGGLVDPAELWLWTEDERDHGERQKLDGLLSRGGGAHVSRMATSAVGVFASTKGQCGATTTTPGEANPGGTSTAAASFNEASGIDAGKEASVGCLPESTMAVDADNNTVSAAQKSEVDANDVPLCGAAPSGGARTTSIGGSTVASGGPSAKCEWCGDVVVAGGKASHSAAFCDEEVVRVRNSR